MNKRAVIKKFRADTKQYERANGKRMFDPLALLDAVPDARYYMVFGERSNGKTYGALWCALLDFFDTGRPFAVVRRYHEDLLKRRADRLMAPLAEWIAVMSDGEWDRTYYYGGMWYLARLDDKGRLEHAADPYAYAYELTQGEHDKSSGDIDYANIIFDEFIARQYLVDEFVILMNVLSTTIRNKSDVRVWMCGNSINPYGCPYWKEMGITHARNMLPGATDRYTYGDSDLVVAVHRTEPSGDKSSSAAYFAFDNPKLSMITGGDWEIDIYPHIPHKLRPCDTKFNFFVKFDDQLLHCKVIKKDGCCYICVHNKTTELQDPDRELIYWPHADPRRNWRQYINRPQNPREKKIWDMFRAGKVFYSDNMVGEVMRNYLETCGA